MGRLPVPFNSVLVLGVKSLWLWVWVWVWMQMPDGLPDLATLETRGALEGNSTAPAVIHTYPPSPALQKGYQGVLTCLVGRAHCKPGCLAAHCAPKAAQGPNMKPLASLSVICRFTESLHLCSRATTIRRLSTTTYHNYTFM